jgi:hypothetical protein
MAEVCVEISKFKPCENWRQFYALWLKVALTASLSWADAVAFVLGILIPLGHKFFPATQESKLAPLAWEIPLAVFCLFGAVRIIIAPYLIYRDRHVLAKQKELEFSQTLQDRDGQIRAITEKPKRSALEQDDYDLTKKALQLVGKEGRDAIRHLRRQASLTFNFGGCTGSLPPGVKLDKTLSAYRHCAAEGLLSLKNNLGNTEQAFEISPSMAKAIDQVLSEEFPGG